MTGHGGDIKVVKAALDETPHREIIIRGVVDPASLARLRVAEYQRETLSPKKIAALMAAICNGGVPDIELGMRGQHYTENGDTFLLHDEVYIIDGLQRTTAALKLLDAGVELPPRLGAKVHFDTSEASEREMFEHINLGQTRLSSNVTLRNQRHIPAIEALYRLSPNPGDRRYPVDKAFPISGQVSWNQHMRRTDLLTASTYVRIVGMLHSHAGPGRSNSALELANGMQKIMDNVGRPTYVANVRTFFDVVDRAWGLKRVAFRHGAPYVKATFLLSLARVLSNHTNFWKDDKLVVDPTVIRKLQSFPINDPEIVRLSSAAGTAGDILYGRFVHRLNSGKRTRRLEPRRGLQDIPVYDDETMLDEEEAES